MEDEVVKVVWAKATDDGLREKSSSGGIFGLLAQDCIGAGGVVYGAAFDDSCTTVNHVRVSDKAGLVTVMRSKYVQSKLGPKTYRDVASDLRVGRRVLFSGTACQVAGIRGWLNSCSVDDGNLACVDVICHGVPAPLLWRKWLAYVSEAGGRDVTNVNFRSKSSGWTTYSVAYYAATEKVRSSRFSDDWYMKAFLGNASLRESCFDCPAKRRCGSDLTIGDFWGIDGVHPGVADSLGVSAVICNTDKGVSLMGQLSGCLDAGPSSMDAVVAGNSALVTSVRPFPRRKAFLDAVGADGRLDSTVAHWNFEPTVVQKVRSRLAGWRHALRRRIQA